MHPVCLKDTLFANARVGERWNCKVNDRIVKVRRSHVRCLVCVLGAVANSVAPIPRQVCRQSGTVRSTRFALDVFVLSSYRDLSKCTRCAERKLT